MAEYRAYTVGDDGHFSGYEPFVCGMTLRPSSWLGAFVTAMTLSFGV
jgi:hypothetical protein